MFHSILLCTHGTEGARQAEHLVFHELCHRSPGVDVTLLTIIDEDWRSMTGDDWLNSSKTHTAFLDHVEEQLGEEIAEEWQRIKKKYPAAADATFIKVVGQLEESIAKEAIQRQCDLIVIGPHRKTKRLFNLKMEKGLRARLKNSKLHSLLPCPLLIAPPGTLKG
ncbi:MAG TPA: universal stress protein [Bacteroides sp.]|nr:universal stress protein [Bacteroides sp.]